LQLLRSFGPAFNSRLAVDGICNEAKLRATGAVTAYLVAYLALMVAANVAGR